MSEVALEGGQTRRWLRRCAVFFLAGLALLPSCQSAAPHPGSRAASTYEPILFGVLTEFEVSPNTVSTGVRVGRL